MADQEFEVLVSTSDFLHLQSKYQDTQIENKKLMEEKTLIKSQLLELTQKNEQMIKKNKKLEDNIVYLSKQGLKMAQSLVSSIKGQNQLKQNKMLEKQLNQKIQIAQNKYKRVQQQKLQLQKIHKQQTTKLQSQVSELNQRYEQKLKSEQKLCKQNQNLKNQLVKLKAELEKAQNLSKNKELTLARMKEQLQLINSRYTLCIQELDKMKAVVKSKESDYQTAIKENAKLSDQLKNYITKWAAYEIAIKQNVRLQDVIKNMKGRQDNLAKMEKYQRQIKQSSQKIEILQRQLNSFKDLSKGQNLEIKQLQQQNKQIKQQIAQSVQTIKFYQSLQFNNQKQKKPSDKKKDLKQIKKSVQQYFDAMALSLIEMGGMSPEQIQNILQSDESAVINYIQDAVDNIFQNRGYNKRKSAKVNEQRIAQKRNAKSVMNMFKNTNSFIHQ